MCLQESCHLGCFVGGEIVGNHMDLLARSTKGDHLVQEGDELFAGVASGGFAMSLAGLHVESGTEGESSVSKVFKPVPFGRNSSCSSSLTSSGFARNGIFLSVTLLHR